MKLVILRYLRRPLRFLLAHTSGLHSRTRTRVVKQDLRGEKFLAEGVGFEPTVRFPVRLISSQVPSTTQPPFQRSRICSSFCGWSQIVIRRKSGGNRR